LFTEVENMHTQQNQLLKGFVSVVFVLIITTAGPAVGQSVYLSANHHTGQFDAWNINTDGTITYQATYGLVHSTDPAGIGIDAVTATGDPVMFISSEFSSGIEIVNPVTLEYMGVSSGPSNLAGVDVDDVDDIVFSLRRQTKSLYIYQWDPVAKSLTQQAIIDLPGMSYGFGIALDDSRDILWVSDTPNRMVRAYDVNVAAWSDIVEIPTLSFSTGHQPIDVAVDSKRNLVYTVGAWFGSELLSHYDVTSGVETTVNVDITNVGYGGMGVAVEESRGYVYMTRGGMYGSGGGNVQVWDCSTSPFTLLQETSEIGNPAGIAIGNVSYNPLNLAKNDVVQGVGVPIGQEFTFEITCDNYNNTSDVTGVTITDDMPVELDFISEAVDGVPGTGVYDPVTHTVVWDIGTIAAGQAGPLVELVVAINELAVEGTTIYNYATIESDQTPPTTVPGEDPECPECGPGTIPLPPALGDLAGTVSADCPVPGTPLLGVEIDLYNSGGDLVVSATTDANGYYEITDLDAGDYTVTIVTPLGYTASQEEVAITIVGGDIVTVDFELTCMEITAAPRTIGFWKHQAGVATGGKGKAQIDASTLCDYLDLIENHFNGNAINQVIVYQPPASGSCEDKLLELKSLLNLKGSVAMIDRARQQLMALLLNVASGKLSQTQIISADGATVSQAITYSDNLIDDPSGDYEKAKTICDEINNNRLVVAGMIPLSTIQIAYKLAQVPATYSLAQNYPNPFNPTTEIGFSLPEATFIKLEVFNIMGQKVATLAHGMVEAGEHVVQWDGSEGASGVYFYRLQTEDFVNTKKMVLLK
jgi:hypothetical protein